MNPFKSLFHSRDKPTNFGNNRSSFFLGNTTSGKPVNEQTAMQMTAVYSCVRILSETVAGLPLHVYRYNQSSENGSYRNAEKAIMGVGDFVAGEHCKFCKAKAQCRARADENLKLAQFEFKKPPLLTNEEVGKALSMALDIKKWASDLEEFALEEILKGNDVEGWKAVEGRSNRTFVNVDEAFTRLTNSGVESALLYERKPISLTAAEKLIGKKQFDEILVNDVIKPQGKPTLVPMADKREPFQLSSAKNDFK